MYLNVFTFYISPVVHVCYTRYFTCIATISVLQASEHAAGVACETFL